MLYTIPYHPRLNAIEQWFNQVKHYIKLDKPSTFIKLKESLTSSILKIKIDNYKNYFINAYNKEIYKKIVKSHQNIKNQRFIRNKKRHLKYATL